MGIATLSPLDDGDCPLIRNIYNEKQVRVDLADFDDDEIKVDYDFRSNKVTIKAKHDESKDSGDLFYIGSNEFLYSFYAPDWADGVDARVHEGMVTIDFVKEEE